MKPRRLPARLRSGDLANVRFSDFKHLVESTGFVLVRVKGSHHLYRHPHAAVLLNLQDVDARAEACQIRQFLRTMAEHGLSPEGFE